MNSSATFPINIVSYFFLFSFFESPSDSARKYFWLVLNRVWIYEENKKKLLIFSLSVNIRLIKCKINWKWSSLVRKLFIYYYIFTAIVQVRSKSISFSNCLFLMVCFVSEQANKINAQITMKKTEMRACCLCRWYSEQCKNK